MTYEEFLALLEAASDPDKGLEALSTLKEHGKTIFTTVDTLTEANTKLTEQVQNLRDTNMALFLKTGSPAPDNKEEQEKTGDEIFDELFTKRVMPETEKENDNGKE